MSLNQNQIYDKFLKETNLSRLQKILARYELFKKILKLLVIYVSVESSKVLVFLLG